MKALIKAKKILAMYFYPASFGQSFANVFPGISEQQLADALLVTPDSQVVTSFAALLAAKPQTAPLQKYACNDCDGRNPDIGRHDRLGRLY